DKSGIAGIFAPGAWIAYLRPGNLRPGRPRGGLRRAGAFGGRSAAGAHRRRHDRSACGTCAARVSASRGVSPSTSPRSAGGLALARRSADHPRACCAGPGTRRDGCPSTGDDMSVTSTYTFLQGFFNGMFIDVNTVSSADQPFSESFNGPILTIHRPSNEIAVDLRTLINTNANIGLITKKLMSAGASLTSEIGVQGVLWPSVPYFIQNIAAHKFTDMLIRIHFDFHIETPWYCSDADGTISIYLFAFLNSSRNLVVALDGTWWHYDGGGPFCTGAISSGLNAAMPGVRKTVSDLLPGLLKQTAGIKFSHLYFLPGDGRKAAGAAIENATSDLTIGLTL
ncbi:MAG TPA: hypothetical protein VF516_23205, partial [Kofleriaceae bacterium]